MNKIIKTRIEWEGKTIVTQQRVEYIDGVPYVECWYSCKMLPITDFRLTRYKDVYHIDRSRTGEREQSYREHGWKPKLVKEKMVDGKRSRLCSMLNEFRPIEEFWQHHNKLEGKMYYSSMCREGKKIENKRYAQSTRRSIKAWKKANVAKVRAEGARRRTTKKQALPKWLTSEHHSQIEEIYAECRRLQDTTGIPHHVHHVYPLHGEDGKGNHISCGLHVPWNLLPVSGKVNCSIGRRNPEYHDYPMS